jgi:hypothetical protein
LHTVARAVYADNLGVTEVGGRVSEEGMRENNSKTIHTPSAPPTMTREPSTLMQQHRNAADSFDTCATIAVT